MLERISFVKTPPEIAELMVKLSSKDQTARVLDTGCGHGVFLEELRKAGYSSCVGIELDSNLYKLCSTQFSYFEILNVDYLDYMPNEKFDLIIGNPPYAHYRSLPDNMRRKVRNITNTSKSDIYYAFILKSIELLNDNGELIYIVPYHFFYNTHARKVREVLLKNGKFEIIIDLSELQIFKNERPEIVIFKYRKGKFDLTSEKIRLLNISVKNAKKEKLRYLVLDALSNQKDNEYFNYSEIPHFTTAEIWSSSPVRLIKFKSRLLKDIAKVGVGLVSGFDEAFRISPEEKENLKEKELMLVKKFVKSNNCQRYFVTGFAEYIVIDDSIKTEDELQTFSYFYEKLSPYKEQMQKRYLPPPKKWFQWQALRNYKFLKKNLDKMRIYVPALDRHKYNRFSLGAPNLLPAGDVLFIQPKDDRDLYFLLGYLNSNFFRNYYMVRGGRRGNRMSFTQRLLASSEIPEFKESIKNKITDLVKAILNSTNNNEIEKLDAELNMIISDEVKQISI